MESNIMKILSIDDYSFLQQTLTNFYSSDSSAVVGALSILENLETVESFDGINFTLSQLPSEIPLELNENINPEGEEVEPKEDI